MKYHR